jgi:lysozyme
MNLQKLYILIKQFEGCRLKAYTCPAGIWTCGWGSTGLDVTPTTVWTQAQADARMQSDAISFAKQVAKLCPNLSDDGLSAIADFAYNLGIGRLKSSTLLKKLQSNDMAGSKKELMKWVKAGGKTLPGLVKRRTAESNLL